MDIADDTIVSLYRARKNSEGERWREDALAVKDLFNNDIWRPMTELGDNEYAATANLALINLNQMAKRATSTQPNVRFMSTKPGQKAADARARKRTLGTIGWHDRNNMKILDRKQGRELLGFGRRVTQIGPRDAGDKNFDCPKWTIRDPLMTYPAPSNFQDAMTPCDVIFAYRQTFGWLKYNYPDTAGQVMGEYARNNKTDTLRDDTVFELLEYIDDDERVIILVAKDIANKYYNDPANSGGMIFRIAQTDNRLGVCPVVIPQLITIDRLQSPYLGNYGLYIMRNKLAALEYYYAEHSVFPEWYFNRNEPNGQVVSMADAKNGVPGETEGGAWQVLNNPVSFNGTQMIDRLSGEERIANSTPAELVGESAQNIRTGARGQQIASAAIDFTIQEIQEIMEVAKEAENKLAVNVYKTYINKPSSFYVSKSATWIDFTPDDFKESDENHVFYSAAGSDINQLVISGGQRIAQQTMSRETFQEIDPLIEDVERERDRIQSEAIDQAGFQAMLQAAQSGALDPLAIASIAQKVKSNQMDWDEALQEVQKERQQAQASNGQPGEPNGPVEPGAPEAQPGIAPGAAQPSIAPSPDQQGLSQLLSSLRRPQNVGAAGA